MKSMFRKAAAMMLSAMMGASLLAGCGSTKIDGSQVVVTVGEEKVELGVVSFYAKYQQAMLYKYYGAMLGTNQMFDMSVAADSSNEGETYGEQMKYTALKDIEKMVVMRQHAEEYEVDLTDAEKDKIEETAKEYIDANSEEVREKIGATADQVRELLELQTIQSKMMDPIVADVDTNVTQEEAQQTAVTYIAFSESTDAQEADSAVEAVSENAVSEEMTQAEAVLSELKKETDVANADMDAVAKTVNADLKATVGHYTTNDTTDGTIDSAVVEAVKDLADGTLYNGVITGSDGKTLYIARLDQQNDETYTETTKASIIRTRKQDKYDEVTDGWLKEATIKVNEGVLKTLKLTDQEPLTLKDKAEEADSSVSENNAG